MATAVFEASAPRCGASSCAKVNTAFPMSCRPKQHRNSPVREGALPWSNWDGSTEGGAEHPRGVPSGTALRVTQSCRSSSYYLNCDINGHVATVGSVRDQKHTHMHMYVCMHMYVSMPVRILCILSSHLSGLENPRPRD